MEHRAATYGEESTSYRPHRRRTGGSRAVCMSGQRAGGRWRANHRADHDQYADHGCRGTWWRRSARGAGWGGYRPRLMSRPESALALKDIVHREVNVPIVADIHFHYKRAIEAADSGAACLRINPGNIGSDERVKEVIRAARHLLLPRRDRRERRLAGAASAGKIRRAEPFEALVESARTTPTSFSSTISTTSRSA